MDIFAEEGVREWITGTVSFSKKEEAEWAIKLIDKYIGGNYSKIQWTTIFGEFLVKTLLNAKTPRKIENLRPDLEDDKFIYEVKTRNYTTSGTAGEKILGTPYKYMDVPILYGKPLKIVLVGFQEQEAIKKFKLFGDASERKKELIEFWHLKDISFIKFSDLFIELYEKK